MTTITHTPAGPGITDRPVRSRETLAGVLVGSDGVVVLEVEEARDFGASREYAEAPLTPDGADRLAALLTEGARMAREKV